jgi:spermidine/putrescine-binding protein
MPKRRDPNRPQPPASKKAKSLFTNRVNETTHFLELLNAPQGSPLPLLMFYGVGGAFSLWFLKGDDSREHQRKEVRSMKTKSLLLIVILGLILALTFKGGDLQAAGQLADTIRVHSLSEGTGKNFEEIVIKPFAQKMGVTIKVVHGTYGKEAEWLAAIKATPGEYCIGTYVSDFGLFNGASQRLFEPLRLENIANYHNLEDKWTKRIIVPGDKNAYVIPVDIGMYTFVYAKDKITQRPDSYSPLFDPKYSGRIALRDYGLYRIFQTASYLKLDPNNMSDQDVDKVFETLASQKKLTRAYWQSSSQLDGLLANREVWLADYWFDTVTRPDKEGKNKLTQLDLGWWFPKEGGPMWAGGPVIAAGCKDPERYTAELIMNFLLQPEILVKYAAAQGYIPTLKATKYDSGAFFAAVPDRAAYRDAIVRTGVVMDVAKISSKLEKWNQRYEELKLSK